MIRTGISTACFYPEPTEQALQCAAQCGARSAEVFINADQEFSPAYIRGLCADAQALDLSIVSVHPFTSGFENMYFFSGYERRFEDGLTLYRRYFDAAARLGADYFILHGAVQRTDLEDGMCYERYAILHEAAQDSGVTLLQENVSRCRSGAPAFIRGLREACPSACFALDTKQALRAGSTAQAMAEAMGSGLRHIHISDFDDGSDCLPPGAGRFDFAEFRTLLGSIGFDGAIVIELYRQSFGDLADLCNSHKFLKKYFPNAKNFDKI